MGARQKALEQRLAGLAGHPHAAGWLFFYSYLESLFIPVPPDVILAPMVLLKPPRWFYYALVCTVSSVLGGITAWAIGLGAANFVVESLFPWIGGQETWLFVRQKFSDWGLFAVIVAGFSPLPYKLFTFGAGVLSLSLPLFIVASLIGRGARFFLVAAAMRFIGARFAPFLKRNMVFLGWLTVIALVLAVLVRYVF